MYQWIYISVIDITAHYILRVIGDDRDQRDNRDQSDGSDNLSVDSDFSSVSQVSQVSLNAQVSCFIVSKHREMKQ